MALFRLSGPSLAVGWSIVTLVGTVAVLATVVAAASRAGFRPALRRAEVLGNGPLKRVALLAIPAILASSATQLNVFVNFGFVAHQPGAVSWLSYAFRFLQLPFGFFIISIVTVSTTRYAEAAARRDGDELARQIKESFRLLAFVTVPVVAAMLIFPVQLTKLVYEHGVFSANDTAATAAALRSYAYGTLGYAGIQLLAPAFLALNRVGVATGAAIASLVVNTLWALTVRGHASFDTFAIGTSIGGAVDFLVLIVAFHATVRPLLERRF